MPERRLFVSWTPHSRPRDLAVRLNADYVVPAAFAVSWWWPLRYVAQAVATVGTVLRRHPRVVLFTNPPFIAGAVCLIAARILRAQCWADCHSGAYNDPRWTRFERANAIVVGRCSGAIFHNAMLATQHNGECRRSVVVSVYAMADRTISDPQPRSSEQRRPLVVAVCSYAFDEPIDTILEAARLVPDIDVVMTGRAPSSLTSQASQNVKFTGWLDAQAYHEAIGRASALVCLTTREATMQNGLIEALEHRRPAVTSSTSALREWARDVPGIITVNDEPAALASALTAIVTEESLWLSRAAAGQRAALRRARDELGRLEDAITSGRPP